MDHISHPVLNNSLTIIRTIYAGNAIMTLRSKDHVKILTVRTTAFEPDESSGGSAAEDKISAGRQFNSINIIWAIFRVILGPFLKLAVFLLKQFRQGSVV